MKIILVGAGGQVGKCLHEELIKTDHKTFSYSKAHLNIDDHKKVTETISNIKPEIVINACAYTDVDKAEEDFNSANMVNNISVKNLANVCKKNYSLLIHLSTDYVFNSNESKPLNENDDLNPINLYGKTKAMGEESIIQTDCSFCIIRTSWIFSEYGKNFMKTMLNLSKTQKELSVVNDQVGNPTYAREISRGILEIVKRYEKLRNEREIYHLSGNEQMTWFDFSKSIFSVAKNYDFKIPKKINPISSDDFQTKAYRPEYSVLDSSKFRNEFNFNMPSLRSSIDEAIRNINNIKSL